MNKLGKLFTGIGLLLRKPSLINLVLEENEWWKEKLKKKYPAFLDGLPVADLQEITGNDEIEIPYYSFLDGGSLPTDYALLKGLASEIPKCRYFEIGTWRGESAGNVAAAGASCVSFNLSDDQMKQSGASDNVISQIGFYVKNNPAVKLLRGDSKTFDFSSIGEKFDLIFIDGDHHYEAVVSDTKKVLAHLAHEKTVIVWHDYTYHPDSIRFEVFKAILDSVPEENHKYLFHIRNTNCAVLLHSSLSDEKLNSPSVPKFRYSLWINSEKM